MAKKDVSQVARTLKALRERAGVAVRVLAQEAGWKPTRYQHYEDRYKDELLPAAIIVGVIPSLVGKGQPSVTFDELAVLADQPVAEIARLVRRLSPARGAVHEAASNSPTTGIDERVTMAFPSANVIPARNVAPPMNPATQRRVVVLQTEPDIDGGFRLSKEKAEEVPCPGGVEGLATVNGIYVTDTSMARWANPGDLLFITTSRQPVIGGRVVVEMKIEAGETMARCFLRELVEMTESRVILLRYNPEKKEPVDRRKIERIWHVLTMREMAK